MKIVLTSVLISSLLVSFNSLCAEITLAGQDNFKLKADYYQAENKGRSAVLMLHQCNYNRSMYNTIGQQLAQQGIAALSLDFRGFGDSVSEKINVDKISELPQEKRRESWLKISAHWPSDVKIAYDFLKNNITLNGSIGVIGASCGGSQAITLAEKEQISAISFFSSAQRDENIEKYQASIADKPTLIIASEEDGRTYTSAQQLFISAKHPKSKMISYKGSSHGYPLYKIDENLENTIVEWFKNELTE